VQAAVTVVVVEQTAAEVRRGRRQKSMGRDGKARMREDRCACSQPKKPRESL